jgi:hypothetical protein
LYYITHDAEKEVELKMDGEVHGFTDQFSFPGIIVPSDFIVVLPGATRMTSGVTRKAIIT